MSDERWKPIPGFSGAYDVSSCGRVRSYQPMGSARGLNPEPRLLAVSPGGKRGGDGKPMYRVVSLTRDKKARTWLVHRLVLMTFCGPCPEGHESAHLNGNPADNRLENLKWSTRAENASHKRLHGTYHRGETVNGSKLTEAKVREARALREAGLTHKQIAERVGTTAANIGYMLKGKTWRHVK